MKKEAEGFASSCLNLIAKIKASGTLKTIQKDISANAQKKRQDEEEKRVDEEERMQDEDERQTEEERRNAEEEGRHAKVKRSDEVNKQDMAAEERRRR